MLFIIVIYMKCIFHLSVKSTYYMTPDLRDMNIKITLLGSDVIFMINIDNGLCVYIYICLLCYCFNVISENMYYNYSYSYITIVRVPIGYVLCPILVY